MNIYWILADKMYFHYYLYQCYGFAMVFIGDWKVKLNMCRRDMTCMMKFIVASCEVHCGENKKKIVC